MAALPTPLARPTVPFFPAIVVTMPGTHAGVGVGKREVKAERDRVALAELDVTPPLLAERDAELEREADGDCVCDRDCVGDDKREAELDGVAVDVCDRGASTTTRPHDADDATAETQNGDDIPVLLPGSDSGALSPNALTRFDIRDEPPPPHCVPPPPP